MLDDELAPAVCSKCREPILWAATVNGKMQPLNYEPDAAGNCRLVDDYVLTKRGVLQRVKVIPKAELEQPSMFGEPPRYMPHHATCPFAEEFRERKTS